MNHENLVQATDLAQMDPAAALVLDCRFELADTARGHRDHEHAHIPGAVYVDLDQDLSGPGQALGLGRHPLPTAERFAASLSRWGWDTGKPVIVYDDGPGAIASRAWWLLRMAGHDKVAVLDGGWRAWQAAELPAEQSTRRALAHDLNITLDTQRLVTSEQLQFELQDQACLLLDARAHQRYIGEVEPIDAVAGHVPGARNRPFTDNLDASGRFKKTAQLQAEFSQLLGDYRPEQIIHMCGSGVTACHNLLAMEHAGLHGSRLYAPSWSGWISDPERPVENATTK